MRLGPTDQAATTVSSRVPNAEWASGRPSSPHGRRGPRWLEHARQAFLRAAGPDRLQGDPCLGHGDGKGEH